MYKILGILADTERRVLATYIADVCEDILIINLEINCMVEFELYLQLRQLLENSDDLHMCKTFSEMAHFRPSDKRCVSARHVNVCNCINPNQIKGVRVNVFRFLIVIVIAVESIYDVHRH